MEEKTKALELAVRNKEEAQKSAEVIKKWTERVNQEKAALKDANTKKNQVLKDLEEEQKALIAAQK